MGKTNNAKIRPESSENLILNSAFDSWQEGTSFAGATNGTYYSDLIQYGKSGAMVHTISRSTDVPTNSTAKFSLDATITTVDASIASGEFALLGYQMEGNDLQRIKGKRFTLSFKVKATKAGVYCVAFRNSASTRSYVAEYTINASNTWEYKEIVIQHDTTGSWNYDETLGMYVTWALAMGSNLQAPSAGSWQNGSYFATANQVNSCDFVSNSFRITEIKINPGVGAGDFCRAGKNAGEELLKIQRFFEIMGGQNAFTVFNVAVSRSSTLADTTISYTRKRVSPTVSFSSQNNFRFSNATNNYLSSAMSVNTTAHTTASITLTTSGIASGNIPGIFDSASAASYIIVNARF